MVSPEPKCGPPPTLGRRPCSCPNSFDSSLCVDQGPADEATCDQEDDRAIQVCPAQTSGLANEQDDKEREDTDRRRHPVRLRLLSTHLVAMTNRQHRPGRTTTPVLLQQSGECDDDGLDQAITQFSAGYADQNSRDYEAFVKAVSDGRLDAVHGV